MENPTFADLIRAREAQQQRIRQALEHQNRLLQEQIDFHPEHAAGSTATTESLRIFKSGLSELQELVELSNKEHLEALHEFQRQMDDRHSALTTRLSRLEEKAIEDERTQCLLREEQMSQQMTLCQDLESLRSIAETNESRLNSRDDAVSALQSSVHALNATTTALEERLVSVDSLPTLFRQEFAELDERFSALSAGVNADRASIAKQRVELDHKHQEEFKLVVEDARKQLEQLNTQSTEAVNAALVAKDRIAEMVQEAVSNLGIKLEGEIASNMNSQAERVTHVQQRQALELHNIQQQVQTNLVELRQQVETALIGLRQQYGEAIDQQLKQLVDKAAEHEERRKEQYPIADSERVQNMVKELESAFTMLEGVARNNLGMSKSTNVLTLTTRIEELEEKIGQVKAIAESNQPKIMFSVPVQTAVQDISPSPDEKVHLMVERHLQQELDLAARDAEGQELRRKMDKLEGSASPLRDLEPLSSVLHRSRSAFEAPTSMAAQHPAQGRSQSEMASGRSMLIGEPGGMSLTAKKAQKESALEKVQSVLREVQAKFHDLTQKEPSIARSSTAEAKRIAELIAQQKEAVYQKERQLIDQRNKLWREINELDEAISMAKGRSTALSS